MDSWYHPDVVEIQLHIRSDSLFACSPNRVKDYTVLFCMSQERAQAFHL